MQGIRILEVADHTFVPAASAVLADWGADVIKIEHAQRGDAARGLASSGALDLTGQVHAILEHANRGKRSLGLDLQTEEGMSVLGTGLWSMGAGVAISHVNNTPWRPVDLSGLAQPLLGNYVTADGYTINITCLQPHRRRDPVQAGGGPRPVQRGAGGAGSVTGAQRARR